MRLVLSELARRLLDSNTHFVLSTISSRGVPQSTVVWAMRDGDEIVFSTIRGRRKTMNMERDPRVSLCGYDPAQPRNYIQVQGTVTLTEEGGKDLINELYLRYDGRSFEDPDPAVVRLVCRLIPTLLVTRAYPEEPQTRRPT